MYAADCRIFDRCGLNYLAVEAESGPIGGDASHEFMVPAENGEDIVLHCPACGYAANQERAEIGGPRPAPANSPRNRWNSGHAGRGTIEQVSKFLGLPAAADDQDAHLSGRRQADRRAGRAVTTRPTRARSAASAGAAKQLELADPATDPAGDRRAGRVRRPRGHEGENPHLADRDVGRSANGVTGANAADITCGRQPGPRFPARSFADLRNAVDGDPCPRLQQQAGPAAAIEVGHVFKLGTKYSEALRAGS